MSADRPDPTSVPLRIENRSDRVWVYGYLRLAPPILWLGGLVGFVFAVEFVHPHPTVGLTVFAVIIVGPLILDRSTLLDPVDFVVLADRVRVKRLAGNREFSLDRLVQITVTHPTGEDYDDRQRAHRFAELAVQFRGARPARLLVSHDDAVRVAAWAAAHQVPLTGRAG